MSENLLLAIALLLLGLEHLGVPIPPWITGVTLVIIVALMFV